MTALTPACLAMLAMERRFYARPGRKEQAIADEFGITATESITAD